MAKDIMSRQDKQQTSSGFINRPGSWENTGGKALGAIGDAAVSGIGAIVQNISMPIADMVLGLFDSGKKPSRESIQQAVVEILSNDEELNKLGGSQSEEAYAGETILGGRDAYGKPLQRR